MSDRKYLLVETDELYDFDDYPYESQREMEEALAQRELMIMELDEETQTWIEV